MHSHIHPIPSPLWVLDLLCDKVEGVPSGVGEQSRVQSQCNVAWILRGAIKQALEVLCLAWITHLLSYYGITVSWSPYSYFKQQYIIWRSSFKASTGSSTLSNLDQASDDDGDKSEDFGVGEEVLDPGAPFYVGTVHKRQQTCDEAAKSTRTCYSHREKEILWHLLCEGRVWFPAHFHERVRLV